MLYLSGSVLSLSSPWSECSSDMFRCYHWFIAVSTVVFCEAQMM